MTPVHPTHKHQSPATQVPAANDLSQEQLADLTDPEKQEEYRRQFLEQIRRRLCPGCGDEGPLPF